MDDLKLVDQMIERGYNLARKMAADGESPADLAVLGTVLLKIAKCAMFTVEVNRGAKRDAAGESVHEAINAANLLVLHQMMEDDGETSARMSEIFAAGHAVNWGEAR